MGKVLKRKINQLGQGWVEPSYLPVGETEYSRRWEQQESGHTYRQLSGQERLCLIRNGNYAPDWDLVQVTDRFMPELIRNSSFFGLVRIGHMSASTLEYKDLRLPVGIYDSYIVSCDMGDDVAIHHVNYLAHFIIGNEVMLHCVNEMLTSPAAKFGNGMVKDGEQENQRIVLELCNENGNRWVIPFEGMQASDAYLWTRYRDDEVLQRRFKEMTEKRFDQRRGYYSKIGESTVIKNSKTIKDVQIGTHAYIKGVNKLKNVTVNSSVEAMTQIGEGCELVNGIIGFGCRVFYGVKAVRFVLSSFSQLKYGARLINSFLGDNSTISCCEVLNTLIFPAHEQHHNNSFLCAALIKGQSNMAAGATVGSNHNSRSADGEVIAQRGFWPGLCVSLKHNSRFASYTLIVKGDFLYELDIKLPFSLVSLDLSKDQLVMVPGYWFMYNAYALMRNTDKFAARDSRRLRNQYFEYDVLAPDTVNEMFDALAAIELAVGKSMHPDAPSDDAAYRELGRRLLLAESPEPLGQITMEGVECSKRKVVLAKPYEGYHVYRRMIRYYAGMELFRARAVVTLSNVEGSPINNDALQIVLNSLQGLARPTFDNVGGQLILEDELQAVLNQIKAGTMDSWDDLHTWYHQASAAYPTERLRHALLAYAELLGSAPWLDSNDGTWMNTLLAETLDTKKWLYTQIAKSREKDYSNPFRQMVYGSAEEMDKVVGSLKDNAFINKQAAEVEAMEQQLRAWF